MHGKLDLVLHGSLQVLIADQNKLTTISPVLFETARNISSLSFRWNRLSTVPHIPAGTSMNLENFDLSTNYGHLSLALPSFRWLQSSTIIQVAGKNQIPCDGHICWYILYEWPFIIDADITCSGSRIKIINTTASYLHCSGK